MMRCCKSQGPEPVYDEPEMFFPMWVLSVSAFLAMAAGPPKSLRLGQDGGCLLALMVLLDVT